MLMKESLYERKEINMKKHLKRTTGIIAALSIISTMSVSAVEIKSYSEDLSVYYNGTNVYAESQYKPIIVNDRTMVQIKPIFELMGFTSDYNDSEKKATFSKAGNNDTYSFIVDDQNIYVSNNPAKSLDVPAMIYNDTFYVPLRAFCETMGMDVDWIGAERKVLVTNNETTETNALSFTNFIGEWKDISNMYLAQHMDIGVKIISVDEANKTITLACKYDMGPSGLSEGESVGYGEPITVSYHEETVNLQTGESTTDKIETTGLKTDFITVMGDNKHAGQDLCRFTLIIPGDGNLYYGHGTQFSCYKNMMCTRVD